MSSSRSTRLLLGFFASSSLSKSKFFYSNFLILVQITIIIITTIPSTNSELTTTTKRGACDLPCSGHVQSLPKYETGLSYTYKYETETTTLLNDDGGHSGVSLDGYAILTAINPCYFDLTVVHLKAKTQFDGQNANVQKKKEITNSSLRFHLENGTISQVCTAEDEPFFSTNIKRSIISLLQLTKYSDGDTDFKIIEVQNDVSGVCPTKIEKIGDVYYKTKNLNECSRREAGPSFINGIPYDTTNEKFKSVPIFDSTLSCKQELYGNVIQRAICKEENIMNPFPFQEQEESGSSNNNNNPKITLKSSLSLITTRRDYVPSGKSSDFIPSTINFHFGQTEESKSSVKSRRSPPAAAAAFETLLVSMCNDFSDNLSKETPGHFLRLKEGFHQLETQNLLQAYQKITADTTTTTLCSPEGQRSKLEQIFLKTAAKTSSVSLMVELITSGRLDVNGDIALEFYKNLAFAQRPGRSEISELLKLIRQNVTSSTASQETEDDDSQKKDKISNSHGQQLLLSASAFAYQYCKITNPNCGIVPEYIQLVDFTAASLAKINLSDPDGDEEDEAVVGLEALGNLEHLTPTAVNNINKCLNSKSNRIKIHGLSAFRRDPCQPLLKNKAKSFFQNSRFGSDIRIHGFLALFRCLQVDDLPLIQRALDNEQSIQVSSFIYSHITNQLESSSPSVQPVKSIVRKLHVEKEFPRSMGSFGRFSKNIELSAFSKTFNLGTVVESNFIYSQHSYIPRTATLNLRTDLFGRSYNFFEVGIYLEKFENLLSRFNGPLYGSGRDDVDEEKEAYNYMDFYSDFDLPNSTSDNDDTASTTSSNSPGNEDNDNLNTILTSTDSSVEEEQTRNFPARINPEDIQYLSNQVKIHDRYKDDGTCGTFLRFHGTTFAVNSIRQKNFPALYDIGWLMGKYDEVMSSFKEAIIERTKPTTFLDEHIVISSIGLPINVKLGASAVFSSKYEFNIDFPSLFSKMQEKEMHVKLIPNLASVFQAKITVGPEQFQAGFLYEGKVHLSGGLDLSLEKKVNSLLINYHFPLDKFRVFELETRLWWLEEYGIVHQRKIDFGPKDETSSTIHVSQCTDNESTYLGFISPQQFGLKYCSTMILPRDLRSLTSPNFWLRGGRSYIKISSEKLDESMKGFSLEIKMNEKTTEESGLSITFDAPGSTTDRKITLHARFLDSALPTIKVHVEYPSKKSPFDLVAKIHDTESLRGISSVISHGPEGQAVPSNYQCALRIGQNGKKILYEPICYAQHGDQDKMDYVEGTVNRGVGEFLDVDLTLKSPFTHRLIIMKGLIQRLSPQLEPVTLSKNGGFHFKLTNGEIAYNNPETADSSMYSLHALVNGEFYQKSPSLGFHLDLKYGKNRPDTDLDLKSSISYIPSQKFGIETKAVSEKLRRFNIDFKFLSELIKEDFDASTFKLQCFLGNFWNLDAVRKAWNDSGSLDLALEIMPLKRKLALHTHRHHIDSDKLTKFDFESTLQWDVGRDEDQMIFLKFHVQKDDMTDIDGSNLYEARKEFTYIGDKHRIHLVGKIPTNLTNGMYNLTAKYVSPADNLYGLNYKNVITKNDPTMSNQMEIRIDLPVLPPTFILWNKYFHSVTSPFPNYKILNDFTILSGDKVAVNVTFSAILVNDNGKDLLYQNGIHIQGLLIPSEVTLTVENEFRIANHKLVSSSSHFDFLAWGHGKWILTHKFVTNYGKKDNLYHFNFNWLSRGTNDEESSDFIFMILPKSIDFSTQFGGRLVSFRDFKLQSNGSLKFVSPSLISIAPMVWGWNEQVERSPNQLEVNFDLYNGLPNGSSIITELKLKAGSEQEKIALIQLSLSHHKEFVLSADFRADVLRPYDLFVLSLSMGKPNYKMWVVSIKQEKDGRDIWVPSVTVSLPGVSIHFLSVLENSPLKKKLTSNLIMYMNGMEEVTRSLSLALDKSEETEDAWNFEIVNIIEHDQTLLKAFGTIVSSGTAAWNGSLEAVHFYGGTGGSLDFFVDVGETEKIIKISRQPQNGGGNNHKEELVDFKLKTTRNSKNNKKNVVVTHEGHLIYPSYRNYQNSYVFGLFPGVDYRLDRNFLSLTSNDKEEGLEIKLLVNQKNFDPLDTTVIKGDFLFKFTDVQKRAFLQYNFGSYQDLVLADLSWTNQVDSTSGGSNNNNNNVLTQKLKLITIHSDMDELDAVDTNDEPDVIKVNVTSGLQWITTSERDSNVGEGQKAEGSKSLCLITEKVINDQNQKTFDVCTLGFSSHRNYSRDDGEKILDLKLTLLDRIQFNGVRRQRAGSLSFGSSFWLDAIDKPTEELKFLVLKETTGTDNINRNYLFSVRHPFLPRELQVKTILDKDVQSNKFSNVVVELDIFEQEIDKVYLIARILSPISEEDDMDSDFDFDFDSPNPKDSGVTSEPAKFEASIQSEGLPILLKFEGTVDSFSGTSYSFMDRNGVLREGKFFCKLPSLFDPNIFQIGETPIISVAFKGVPRLELHPLEISKNSLIVEYHGSPHQLRFFNLGSQEQVIQKSNDDAGAGYEDVDAEDGNGDGRDRHDPDDFTFHSLTVPTLSEEEVMIGFSKRHLGLTNSLLNVTVKLNTSKLIRIENNWKSRGIKESVSELESMRSLWVRDLKSNVISSASGISKNAIHYKDVFLNALPSIQRLLTKLEDEFETNMENIQGDPRANFFYEFASEAILQLYQHTKSATSLMALMVHQFSESVVEFITGRDWEEEFREAYFYAQDQTVAAILLGLGKIDEVLTWAVAEVTKFFETYSTNNPEFDQIRQTVEEAIQVVKTQAVTFIRYLLRKTIMIRPILRWALPKEAHEFLVSLKHYFLGQLEGDEGGTIQDSDTEFDVGNVTSAYVVLFKGFTTMSSMGQRVLERKGFVLEVNDESLVVQFPLPKPARILRDILNSPEKESFFGPKYKTSLNGFYQWITEPAVYDSRLPKWSVIMSRLDNIFLGGIGPQDALAIIIDGKIYRTFDGRFHTFDGSCTYLLAADFPNATLAMDGGDGDESLSRTLVFTYGEESLMVHRNSSVEYNGRLAEIPRTESFAEFIALNLGSFKGYQYGNVLGDVREITRDHSGMDVACLVNYPVCSIRLKNYLFGRSSGLLGTNNLESMDEFMTPTGEVVGKTSRFYRSWLLNRECKETKGNILNPLEASPGIKQRCSEIFTSETSPMQPCFDEVASVEFQEVCERLATEWQNESKNDDDDDGGDAGIQKAICTVAAAYWVQCTENRVTMDYLSKC